MKPSAFAAVVLAAGLGLGAFVAKTVAAADFQSCARGAVGALSPDGMLTVRATPTGQAVRAAANPASARYRGELEVESKGDTLVFRASSGADKSVRAEYAADASAPEWTRKIDLYGGENADPALVRSVQTMVRLLQSQYARQCSQ